MADRPIFFGVDLASGPDCTVETEFDPATGDISAARTVPHGRPGVGSRRSAAIKPRARKRFGVARQSPRIDGGSDE